MILDIVSYAGTAINDSTNYVAWFPVGQPVGPNARINYSTLTRDFAFLSNKEMDGGTLFFHILCKGTIHSQFDTLKALFRVDDYTQRQLIVQDTQDSNRQWYVMGYPSAPLRAAGDDTVGEYIVELALDSPVWRTVTASTSSWSITASNQTKALTVLGNQPAKPSITLAIGSAKSGGYARKWWKPLYNPLTLENRTPWDITNGGWNTSTLVADTSVSNQINNAAGITAVATTIAIDTAVGGGLPTGGGMCYVDTEQIYYTSISAGSMTVYSDGAGTTGRGWGGTTAATHADNAVLKKSHMQANGADVRVVVDGAEVDRWLDGMNSSSTKIWYNPKYLPLNSVTLNAAIASSGAVGVITLARTPANKAALKRLPPRFIFVIDSEVFVGSNPRPSTYKFTTVSRAQRSSSSAAHSKGATVRFLEHDVWLMWGNPLVSAPVTDDTVKPVVNLTSSTNTSWVHAEMGSDSNSRTAAWVPAIVSRLGRESNTYTATQETEADPATVVGFKVKPYTKANVLKADTVIMTWSIYHPAGFTTITMTGSKRRVKAGWLNFGLEKSLNGTTYATVFTEAAPTALNTWSALSSHSATSLSGNYPYLRLIANGSIAALTGNANDFEVGDDTLAINSSNVLQAAITTSAEDNYYIDCEITCDETGDSILLQGPTKVGSSIVIDCEAQTFTVDGEEGALKIDWNTNRTSWLDLPSPKQSSTCTLRYVDTGTAGITGTIEWENRSSL